MTHTTSVTVVASFELMPDRRQVWRDVWRELGSIAERSPACHSFRLLQHAEDDTHCMVVSDWSDLAAFDRFVRDTHLLWIERAVPYASNPTTFAFLQDVPDGQEQGGLERELVFAGAARS